MRSELSLLGLDAWAPQSYMIRCTASMVEKILGTRNTEIGNLGPSGTTVVGLGCAFSRLILDPSFGTVRPAGNQRDGTLCFKIQGTVDT